MKEIALSAEKAIFPNLKGEAFSGRQNDLIAISTVLATWKSAFSKPEINGVFCSKGDFSDLKEYAFWGHHNNL